MLFNSYEFILLFLPLSVIGYFIANRYAGKNAGNVFLILASLVFYFPAGTECIAILLCGIVINYLFAGILKKHRSKALFTLAICSNILLLLYFKYCNFFIENFNAITHANVGLQHIILPLGISFYTFQQISYLISVYKGSVEKHSFLEYCVYILYFPKLIMGPLIEPNDFIRQLRDDSLRRVNTDNLVVGMQMFARGLCKKVILADTFANAVNWGFKNFYEASSGDWMLIIFFYSFQIYFDFSGYSDMAIAVSKFFNIELPINFNSPYKSYSLRDFWKRWHMSLTGFLTGNIYIPLGGNRKGEVRTYVNMFIVFLVSGLWHGANWTFILWGVLHGAICIAERLFDKKLENVHSGFRWALTFFIVSILWMLFRAESVQQWVFILKKAFSFTDTTVSEGLLLNFVLPEFSILINHLLKYLNSKIYGFPMLMFLTAAFLIVMLFENNCKRNYKADFFTALVTVLLLVWGLISLSGESVFVYFGF